MASLRPRMGDLRDIFRAAIEDTWATANGSIDGRLSTVRYRPGLSSALGHPALPRRLLITWEYGDDGESGQPSDETELHAFERTLHEALDRDRSAVLAFVFTHLGVREWHYYAGDLDLIDDKINEALADQPDLPISIKAFDDPQWTELAAVLRRIQGEPAERRYG
jgi:hypothetical protein